MAPDRARDPLSSVSRETWRLCCSSTVALEESLAENRRAFELNPNGGENLDVDIARVLILLGRYDEAIAVLPGLSNERNRDYLLALLHNAPGRRKPTPMPR